MKKTISIVFAVLMLLSLCIPIFAADEGSVEFDYVSYLAEKRNNEILAARKTNEDALAAAMASISANISHAGIINDIARMSDTLTVAEFAVMYSRIFGAEYSVFCESSDALDETWYTIPMAFAMNEGFLPSADPTEVVWLSDMLLPILAKKGYTESIGDADDVLGIATEETSLLNGFVSTVNHPISRGEASAIAWNYVLEVLAGAEVAYSHPVITVRASYK